MHGRSTPRRSRLGLLLAMGAVAVLAVSGCTSTGAKVIAEGHRRSPTTTTLAPSTTTTSTTSTTLPPVSPISWAPCQGDLQCGTLTVPLNYGDPKGPTIGIAVARHPADDPADRIGALVINPGGPGVSGIDDLPNELSVLTPQLLDDFDIVSFDPRGVQRSDPVTCGETPGAAPGNLPDPVPHTPAAQLLLLANDRDFSASCEKASGAVLPYVGTVDVARDLEELRIALGGGGLSYMGQSYGTLLGLTYAQMYPTHIRAMVLDSVIDPALTFDQITLGQAEGFEGVLQQFFDWCGLSTSCPWRPGGDPTTGLLALIAASRVHPAAAGNGRTAGPGELYDALLDGLYSESDWPGLGQALAADAAGNGAPAVAMSNSYNQNGSTNGDDAAEAIDCLDHPVARNVKDYPVLAYDYAFSAPVFGPLLAWGEVGCALWAVPPTRTPAPVTAPGSPPLLVVGTTHDPATPYAWAQAVAGQLAHGVLLTRDGSDHVAYFYSACVRSYVQSYFVSGVTPPAGTVCAS